MRSPYTRHRDRLLLCLPLAACAVACTDSASVPTLSKGEPAVFRVGERSPDKSEAGAAGAPGPPLSRRSADWDSLVLCRNSRIVFKDEEKTQADRRMTPRLRQRLQRLAELVQRRWPDVQLRVTEAWDEQREHGRISLHYEGRAADVTTSDMDPNKLGALAQLCVQAGMDWVFFEDRTHVHVSVRK
ncbi:MAG TPA: hypothetical protein VK524_32375 [Polyangiaceae bacterium]|nr:hypothetical protein [Polyangiaceae bacterium]